MAANLAVSLRLIIGLIVLIINLIQSEGNITETVADRIRTAGYETTTPSTLTQEPANTSLPFLQMIDSTTNSEFVTVPPLLTINFNTVKDWSYIEYYEDLPNEDKTKLFIQGFSSALQRYIIAKQLSACPYTPLCMYRLNASIDEPFYQPCCTRCSCLPNCTYYNSCCPDILTDFGDSLQEKMMPVCTPLHLNMDVSPSINTYAISQCMGNSDYTQRYQCIRDYDKSTLKMVDILPVLHNNSGTVYRNIHCALCNGVQETELEIFKPELQCYVNIPTQIKSESDFIQNMRKSDNCDVRFTLEYFTADGCRLSISECNVTGLWETFNADYVKACALYKSEIKIDHGPVFQNVFCAICNGYIVIPARCSAFTQEPPSLPYSFSGLLNFDVDTEDDYPVKPDCDQGYMYNNEENGCIPVRCSSIRILAQDTCVKMVDTLTSFKYLALLRLTPSTKTSLQYAYDITDSVFIELKQFLQSYLVQDSFNLHICSVEILLTTNSPCTQNTTDMLSEFGSYLVRLEFVINNEHDPEQTLSRLFRTSFDVSHITGVLNETMHVTLVNTDQTDFDLGQNAIYDTENDTLYVFCSDSDNKTVIAKHVPITDSECWEYSGIDPIPILSLLTCPMVAVNHSNDPWLLTQDGVLFPDRDKSFEHSTFYLPEENTTSVLYLCSEQYLEIIQINEITNRTITADLIVSIICVTLSIACLLITLFIFCLLKPLRTLPGKNNISLVCSLLAAQVLYLTGSFSRIEKGSLVCKIVGVLTHFSWLLVIFWMNICTFHMFRVLTKTKAMSNRTGNKQLMIYHIYSSVSSTIFVSINMAVSSINSDFYDIGYGLVMCYISSQEMIVYTFGIPLSLVIAANIVMFLFVVVTIRRSSGVVKNVKNERNDIAIFARLSTLTGATWIFGFMYMWTQSIVFSYLFTILNAGQGVFIFFSFICTNRVLKMLKQNFSQSSFTQTSSVMHTASTGISRQY